MNRAINSFVKAARFLFENRPFVQLHIHRQCPAREMRVAVELIAPDDFGSLAGLCVSKGAITMLVNTNQDWIQVRKAQLMDVGKPTLSPQFLDFVVERLSTHLLARLRESGDEAGARLLEDLLALMQFPQMVKDGQVSGLWDENVISVLGQVSWALDWSVDE